MITGQNSVRLRRVLRPLAIRRAGACPWGSISKHSLGCVYVILWKIEFNCCIIKSYKYSNKGTLKKKDYDYEPICP